MDVAMSSITKDGYTYTRNDKEKEGWKFADKDDSDYENENMDEMNYEDEDMDNLSLKCKK
jgi:hypothetical protein